MKPHANGQHADDYLGYGKGQPDTGHAQGLVKHPHKGNEKHTLSQELNRHAKSHPVGRLVVRRDHSGDAVEDKAHGHDPHRALAEFAQ